MRERPILFSGPMVRALIAGTKTQTRRLVRDPSKRRHVLDGRNVDAVALIDRWCRDDPKSVVHVAESGAIVVDTHGGVASPMLFSPYGVPGDRLWVRETHAITDVGDVLYRATHDRELPPKWKPSIFMRRAASRILIEITEVRVERLQDISDDDARAEGLGKVTKDGGRTWKYGIPDRDRLPGTDDDGWPWREWCVDPWNAYAKLWDSINAERAPWSSNPWAWVVSFKMVVAP